MTTKTWLRLAALLIALLLLAHRFGLAGPDNTNLSGHYPLDEGQGTVVTDQSGLEHHGQLLDATWAPLVGIGGSAHLEGLQYLALDPQALQGATDFTLSCWINTTESGTQVFFHGVQANPYDIYPLVTFFWTEELAFFIRGINGFADWTLTEEQKITGGWHHLAYVGDHAAQELRFYLDGKLIGTAPRPLDALDISHLFIGPAVFTYERAPTLVDEVRLYTRALSADEIALDLYAQFDSDGDGLPDWWELLHFGNTQDFGGLDDYDQDGKNNAQEFAEDSDPNDPFNDQPPVLTIISGDDQAGWSEDFLPEPLVIEVKNSSQVPLPNIPVTWKVTLGTGLLAAELEEDPMPQVQTASDFLGQSYLYFQPAGQPGQTNTVTVSVGPEDDPAQVDFQATLLELKFPPAPTQPLAPGAQHSLWSNGATLWVWGSNAHGQLGHTEQPGGEEPLPVANPHQATIGEITALAAGAFYSLALNTQGKLYTWGRNDYGQLGTGDTDGRTTPTAITALDEQNLTAIAAGHAHSLALDDQGRIWAWGMNSVGQLGYATPNSDPSLTPQLVRDANNQPLENIVALAAYQSGYDDNDDSYSLALQNNGRIWNWGRGQAHATEVEGIKNAIAIAAGCRHSLALKADGSVWSWPEAPGVTRSALGIGKIESDGTPAPVLDLEGYPLEKIARIGAGAFASFAAKQDGTLWSWGVSKFYYPDDFGDTYVRTLGYPQYSQQYTARKITWNIAGHTIDQIQGGYGHALALSDQSIPFALSSNKQGQLGINSNKSTYVFKYVQTPLDSDGDGLPDWWEAQWGLDPNNPEGDQGAEGDPDSDGLTNAQEYAQGTDPLTSDTDGDGLNDSEDPDPLNPDIDDDGMPDGYEVTCGFDPTDPADAFEDADGDGIRNLFECVNEPEPLPDTPISLDAQAQPQFIQTGYNQSAYYRVVSDGNGGSAYDTVFTSLGAAISKAQDSDHAAVLIFVEPGLHIENEMYLNWIPVQIVGSGTQSIIELNPEHQYSDTLFNIYKSAFISRLELRGHPQDAGIDITSNAENVGLDHLVIRDFGKGTLSSDSPHIEVNHCAFIENEHFVEGVSLRVYSGHLTASHCIFWNDDDEGEFYTGNNATLTIEHSLVRDLSLQGVNGNLHSDTPPLLTHDGHLTATASAIDLGTANPPLPDDVDGELRPQGLLADAGIDEWLDSDADALPDWWELENGLDPNNPEGDQGGAGDFDQDGLSNLAEYIAGTDPSTSDGDSDGLEDAYELENGTDPNHPDSDGDEVPDGYEVWTGANPLDATDAYADPDGDGYPNRFELHYDPAPTLAPVWGQDPNQHPAFQLGSKNDQPIYRVEPGENDADPEDNLYHSVKKALYEASKLGADLHIIQVAPGIYQDNILDTKSSAKRLLLLSESGPGQTRIATTTTYTAFEIHQPLFIHGFHFDGSKQNTERAFYLSKQGDHRPYLHLTNCVVTGYSEEVLRTNRNKTCRITHCTIVNNGGEEPYDQTFDISYSNYPIIVENSIIWNPDMYKDNYYNVQIANSIIRVEDLNGIDGNLYLDPLPSLRADGHLLSGAPGIDQAPLHLTAPLDGQGEQRAPQPDMGMDEWVDSDSDGLPDWWELDHQLDPNNSEGEQGGSGDPDSDGLTNLQEYAQATDPNKADTDADGLDDKLELETTGTDPLNPDSDGDTMPDGYEHNTPNHNPLDLADANDDSDQDSFLHAFEYHHGSDPNDPESVPLFAVAPYHTTSYYRVDANLEENDELDNQFTNLADAIRTAEKQKALDYFLIDIAPGTYLETGYYALSYKRYFLRSISGPAQTIISRDGGGSTLNIDQNSIIEGLTLTHPVGKSGSGIDVYFSYSKKDPDYIRIRNCIIRDNEGYGVSINNVGDAKIEHCTLLNNYSTNPFYSVNALYSGGQQNLTITNSIFYNPAGDKKEIKINGYGNTTTITHCLIRDPDYQGQNGNIVLGEEEPPELRPDGHQRTTFQGRDIGLNIEPAYTDMDGEPRPVNAIADIGPDEWLDSDGDGLPDWWELENGLDPNNPDDGGLDPDEDDLNNQDEYDQNTDPQDPDTDDDGIPDNEDPDPNPIDVEDPEEIEPDNPDPPAPDFPEDLDIETDLYTLTLNPGTPVQNQNKYHDKDPSSFQDWKQQIVWQFSDIKASVPVVFSMRLKKEQQGWPAPEADVAGAQIVDHYNYKGQNAEPPHTNFYAAPNLPALPNNQSTQVTLTDHLKKKVIKPATQDTPEEYTARFSVQNRGNMAPIAMTSEDLIVIEKNGKFEHYLIAPVNDNNSDGDFIEGEEDEEGNPIPMPDNHTQDTQSVDPETQKPVYDKELVPLYLHAPERMMVKLWWEVEGEGDPSQHVRVWHTAFKARSNGQDYFNGEIENGEAFIFKKEESNPIFVEVLNGDKTIRMHFGTNEGFRHTVIVLPIMVEDEIYMFNGHSGDVLHLRIGGNPTIDDLKWRLKSGDASLGVFADETTSNAEFKPLKPSKDEIELTINEKVVWSAPIEIMNIILRSSWGADPAKPGISGAGTTPGDAITFHHSANTESGAAEVRRIQDFHMSNFPYNLYGGKGWDDIGYHALIDKSGKIYEGRRLETAPGVPPPGPYTKGSHTGGANTVAGIGICMLGDYEGSEGDEIFSNKMQKHLEKVLIATCRRYNIDREKVSYHRAVQIANGVANPSKCAGSNAIAKVPEVIKKITYNLRYDE